MKKLLRFFTLLGVLLSAVQASSQEALPKYLWGMWRVTGVRLDSTFTRRPNYSYNDSRLLGHEFKITAKTAYGKMPEKATCIRPIIRSESTSMNELIESTMGKQEEQSEVEAVKRYNLPIDGSKNLQVIWIGCKEGDFGPDAPLGPEGFNWITLVSENQIAMR